MKPYAPRSRPRLGPWFHSFNKDGGLDRQGKILSELQPGIYLVPAALAVAQAALTPIASAKLAAMTVPGLARALDREGYLVTSNRAGRGVYTVRRRIKGRWREVFHLRAGRAADGPIAVPVAPLEVPAEESPFPR